MSLRRVAPGRRSRAARFLIDAIQPPNDAYFVRVRPTSCAACAGAPGVWISTVSFALEFRASCSQPFEVAVVGTSGDTTCALPNTFRILRGPVAVTRRRRASASTTSRSPLGGRVPLLGDAYCGSPSRRTARRLHGRWNAAAPAVTTAACSPCVAWNYYPADTLDLCAALYPRQPDRLLGRRLLHLLVARRHPRAGSGAGGHQREAEPHPFCERRPVRARGARRRSRHHSRRRGTPDRGSRPHFARERRAHRAVGWPRRRGATTSGPAPTSRSCARTVSRDDAAHHRRE